MISAVVLLNTEIDAPKDVLDNVKQVQGVEEAHSLYGVYDLLVKVKANSVDEIKNITKTRIKQVPGITSSLTLMIDDHNDISTLRPSLL